MASEQKKRRRGRSSQISSWSSASVMGSKTTTTATTMTDIGRHSRSNNNNNNNHHSRNNNNNKMMTMNKKQKTAIHGRRRPFRTGRPSIWKSGARTTNNKKMSLSTSTTTTTRSLMTTTITTRRYIYAFLIVLPQLFVSYNHNNNNINHNNNNNNLTPEDDRVLKSTSCCSSSARGSTVTAVAAAAATTTTACDDSDYADDDQEEVFSSCSPHALEAEVVDDDDHDDDQEWYSDPDFHADNENYSAVLLTTTTTKQKQQEFEQQLLDQHHPPKDDELKLRSTASSSQQSLYDDDDNDDDAVHLSMLLDILGDKTFAWRPPLRGSSSSSSSAEKRHEYMPQHQTPKQRRKAEDANGDDDAVGNNDDKNDDDGGGRGGYNDDIVAAYYDDDHHGYYVDDAAYAAADDYGAVANDDGGSSSSSGDDVYGFPTDDGLASVNEQCSTFLVSFLEGSSNARDTCEGIMNAYTAAECVTNETAFSQENDFDDYFEEFYEHTCCQALLKHHSKYCEEEQLLSSMHLLVAATVLLLCELAKSAVKEFDIHFLPDAATCILVGTFCGFIAHVIPGVNINGIVFDENLFMSVLLPPIIFEAALSVSKTEFKRRRGAILMFAIFGTVISTFTTGLLVHYVSKCINNATTFPVLDSLVFGALISSIDPVAILSVLTSLHLNETDTVFILVFGESLLNDGIAITVFKTLVHRFDGQTKDRTTSVDEILDALANFLIAMFGSLLVGVLCGICSYFYFSLLEKKLSPVMEVGSFFLWALIPFYISEWIELSGIVAIVVMGFIMDIYIASPKNKSRTNATRAKFANAANAAVLPNGDNMNVSLGLASRTTSARSAAMTPPTPLGADCSSSGAAYVHMKDEENDRILQQQHKQHHHNVVLDDIIGDVGRSNNMNNMNHGHHRNNNNDNGSNTTSTNNTSTDAVNNPINNKRAAGGDDDSIGSIESAQSILPFESTERLRLSAKADKHVRFVAHLTSQLAETAIFAYVGLFLLSNNYDWDPTLVSIAISSCILSRAFMVVTVSYIIYNIYRLRGVVPARQRCHGDGLTKGVESFDSPDNGSMVGGEPNPKKVRMSRTARAITDVRTQMVLVMSGLRGAVSLALVENVPLFNAVSGEGCEYKPLLKAMTSGSIIFTTFVFGGGGYYILPHLGLAPDRLPNRNGVDGNNSDANSTTTTSAGGYGCCGSVPMMGSRDRTNDGSLTTTTTMNGGGGIDNENNEIIMMTMSNAAGGDHHHRHQRYGGGGNGNSNNNENNHRNSSSRNNNMLDDSNHSSSSILDYSAIRNQHTDDGILANTNHGNGNHRGNHGNSNSHHHQHGRETPRGTTIQIPDIS